jgi:hypothetical protein
MEAVMEKQERRLIIMTLCKGPGGNSHEPIVTQHSPCPLCDLMEELKQCKEYLAISEEGYENIYKKYDALIKKSRRPWQDHLESLKQKKVLNVGGDGI